MNPYQPPNRPPEGSREFEEELEAVLARLPEATILSPEGTREVLMEIKYGSPLTTQRKAMLERVRAREAVRKRLAAMKETED